MDLFGFVRHHAKSVRKITWAGLLFVGSISIGLVGFMLLEQYTLLEAIYMSIITLSTVGFHEIRPLSDGGRVFTIVYIILNLGIFAYFVSVFTSYFFEGEFRKLYQNYMSGREVKKLKEHVIVCGYGRNGMKACDELTKWKKTFVLVEKEKAKLDAMQQSEGKFHFVCGDATVEDTLIQAGIEQASFIITTLPKDTDNVYIVLTARELNPNITIIARASEENSEKKLRIAGAHRIVRPDTLGGLHMAQLVTKPDVIEFLDVLHGLTKDQLSLEEVKFQELKEEFKFKTIRELDIRKKTGITVVGYKDDKKGFLFNPSPDTVVGPEDVLIILGEPGGIEEFRKLYAN